MTAGLNKIHVRCTLQLLRNLIFCVDLISAENSIRRYFDVKKIKPRYTRHEKNSPCIGTINFHNFYRLDMQKMFES